MQADSIYMAQLAFVEYLDRNNIEYSPDEITIDLTKYCFEYLKGWCANYNKKKNFDDISDLDMFDVINGLNGIFGLGKLSRSKYVTKIKEKESKLTQENKRLKNMLQAERK